jgi:hypothetical protein
MDGQNSPNSVGSLALLRRRSQELFLACGPRVRVRVRGHGHGRVREWG